MAEPVKLRLRFSKEGRAIYLSHLDLMRTLQRSFLRAGLALKYSEGFNPHPVISILLPLGVGCASVCELMDFSLAEERDPAALPALLNPALPEGISAQAAYPGGRKARELKWLRVAGRLEYDRAAPADMCGALAELYARPALPVEKKTKRGLAELDLVPAIRSLSLRPEAEAVAMDAVISAQEPTLNPELLIAAIRRHAPELAPDFAEFTRREVYDAEMNVFM